MRKLFPMLAVSAVLAFGFVGLVKAAEDKTITGDAVCAKCALKETKTCQNVVILKEDDKDVTYYLEGAESKAAHAKLGICMASKDAPIKVKVTGKVGEKDGKKTLEVSKIEKVD